MKIHQGTVSAANVTNNKLSGQFDNSARRQLYPQAAIGGGCCHWELPATMRFRQIIHEFPDRESESEKIIATVSQRKTVFLRFKEYRPCHSALRLYPPPGYFSFLVPPSHFC